MTTPDQLHSFAGAPTPIEDGENVAICAQGEPAKYITGIEYRGPHETVADGTNRAVRLNARALASAGLPLLLTSFAHIVVDESGICHRVFDVGLPEDVENEVGPLRRTSIGTVSARILHMVVTSADHLRRSVLPRSYALMELDEVEQLLATTVVYSVWERDRIDREIVEIMNRCGQQWVPCEQNKQMLVDSGVIESKVKVVPHPFDPESKIAKLTKRPAGYRPPDGATKRFYSIGHWQPRKGYHELIGAFLQAYGPNDDATLTLKINGHSWPDYPNPEESVSQWLQDSAVKRNGWDSASLDKRVTLIRKRISEDQIVKLHFENNIYVSASRGEAWNLGAWDAKIAGNVMVHVPYGGTADFEDMSRDLIVPYHMAPVHSSYRWEPGAQWADFDQQDLVEALRDAQPAPFVRTDKFNRFTIESVGKEMRANLLNMLELTFPQAWEYLNAQR